MKIEQLLRFISRRIKQVGSQKAAAAAWGVSQQFLSDVLYKRKSPSARLLRALDVREEVRYVKARTHGQEQRANTQKLNPGDPHD